MWVSLLIYGCLLFKIRILVCYVIIFVTAEFERVQVFLHAVSFDNSHTGDQIASTLINCLQAWGIFDVLHVGVCDNGSNFVAGLRDSNIPNIPCLAHTLQLVVHDGCLAQPSATSLTAKARKLVGYYRRSNWACKAFHRIQEQLNCSVHKLIQDEPIQPIGIPHIIYLTGFLNRDRPLPLQTLN